MSLACACSTTVSRATWCSTTATMRSAPSSTRSRPCRSPNAEAPWSLPGIWLLVLLHLVDRAAAAPESDRGAPVFCPDPTHCLLDACGTPDAALEEIRRVGEAGLDKVLRADAVQAEGPAGDPPPE